MSRMPIETNIGFLFMISMMREHWALAVKADAAMKQANSISKERPNEIQTQYCCHGNPGSQLCRFLWTNKRIPSAGKEACCNRESQGACKTDGRRADSGTAPRS